LDRHIREHLDIILPSGCVRIELEPAAEYFYTGTVVDRRGFGSSHWFLGVRASTSQANLISAVPRLVKVGSAKHIVTLVQMAFPGLPLEHVVSPPAEISPRLGTQYFAIQKTGPMAEKVWDAVVNTGQVGVYAPADIPDVELELLVVLDA
jgi:type VI secretion system protein ImpJ